MQTMCEWRRATAGTVSCLQVDLGIWKFNSPFHLGNGTVRNVNASRNSSKAALISSGLLVGWSKELGIHNVTPESLSFDYGNDYEDPPSPPVAISIPSLADPTNLAQLSFPMLSPEELHNAVWQSGSSRCVQHYPVATRCSCLGCREFCLFCSAKRQRMQHKPKAVCTRGLVRPMPVLQRPLPADHPTPMTILCKHPLLCELPPAGLCSLASWCVARWCCNACFWCFLAACVSTSANVSDCTGTSR